jgi:hypothetical protein
MKALNITDDERDELATLFSGEEVGNYHSDTYDALSYVAKLKGYITDCPGYAGDIYVVIFPASPNLFEIVTRDRDGGLYREVHENTASLVHLLEKFIFHIKAEYPDKLPAVWGGLIKDAEFAINFAMDKTERG